MDQRRRGTNPLEMHRQTAGKGRQGASERRACDKWPTEQRFQLENKGTDGRTYGGGGTESRFVMQ